MEREGQIRTMKESEQVRGTDSLKSVEGGKNQNNERK